MSAQTEMDKQANRRELDAAIMEAVRGERRFKRHVTPKKPAAKTPIHQPPAITKKSA